MKDKVFIDPSAITPKQLSDCEMSAITGSIPIVVVIWVTTCGDGLAITVAAGIVTIVDK